MTRAHRAAATFVALLPLAWYLVGRGGLGFTMYASSVWFRTEIVAWDTGGRARYVPPTRLAREVVRSAAPFLSGADHLRRTYEVAPLRRHLGDVGRLACRVEGEASNPTVSVDVTLVERTGESGPLRETREHVVCGKR